jgi:hypothetical protein
MATSRRAASATESSIANEAKVTGETKVAEGRSECGDCKMGVGRMDKRCNVSYVNYGFIASVRALVKIAINLWDRTKFTFIADVVTRQRERS